MKTKEANQKKNNKKLLSFSLMAIATLGYILLRIKVVSANVERLDMLIDSMNCFFILTIAMILFFTELVPLAVTSMFIPIALSFPGIEILSGKVAFSNFGNKWVVTFIGIFIVSDAIFRTGLANKLGEGILRFTGHSQRKILVILVVSVAFLSAFLSNAATVSLFIPVILSISKAGKISPSKLFMPAAFASSLGGNLTLIGVPSKGIVNGIMETMGVTPFGFFDYTIIGSIMFVVGLLYFAFIGHKILPDGNYDHSVKDESRTNVEFRTDRMIHSVVIFIFVVIAMVTKILPYPTAAMLGVCLMVVTGCTTMKEAYGAVSWNIVFLFAGMLAMSKALIESGATTLIAEFAQRFADSPLTLLAAVYILTVVITNFMSNSATAAVMTPVAISVAQGAGINPIPFAMTIGIGVSLCFLTPIATNPNVVVYELGGYKFEDYFKFGLPLQLITMVCTIIFIPLLFPF